MQVLESNPNGRADQQIFANENKPGMDPQTESAAIKSHCWYCSRPLYNRRTFCNTECREALYEDNERARERRLILGCQC